MGALLKWSLTSLLLACSFHPATASAEQAKHFGDYVVHYNTLSTDILEPGVAKEYDIQRSRSRAMITITVIHQGDGKAVPAELKVTSGMLTGHKQSLEMHEIREGDAIYYISDFPVAHRDTLNFAVRVKPEGSQQSHTFEFEKQFFTE
ncbi:DUF4426 domain-containing protein [Thiohalophilus sp.]|uniref:DUF4426 domain-containing protein n=1 Tax=Thiohalophilus sp. TaxID=3028392 RepID=UPI003974E889